MPSPTWNDSPFSVLFVDDEEKALKYFARAFSGDISILTASSVEEAIVVLERNADRIGVVITDQRMPDKNGVVLLNHVKEHYPLVTRILTTAYSDLDDAVAAVNRGEIFRYITKPWDLQVLRAELLQAMSYFVVQYERNKLVNEKLTVWQHTRALNGLRDLMVMSCGFRHLRFPVKAVYEYLSRLSDLHLDFSALGNTQQDSVNVFEQFAEDINSAHNLFHYLAEMTQVDSDESDFTDSVDVNLCLRDQFAALSNGKTDIVWRMSDSDTLVKGNKILLARMFQLFLVSTKPCMSPGMLVSLSTENGYLENVGCQGVKIMLKIVPCGTVAGPAEKIKSALVFQKTMLAAFLICYHHGGRVMLDRDKQSCRSIEILLPFDAASTGRTEPENDWISEIIGKFENSLIHDS
ncbi:MAG: response regulator [Gammaproteobacteria bacterium]|nr:response regulator [Gammaproteobacteria bacterium]MDH5653677.1 response regulator [Gammaproteobacteria bacterium]